MILHVDMDAFYASVEERGQRLIQQTLFEQQETAAHAKQRQEVQ